MCLSPGSPRPRKSVRGRCLEPDVAGNWFAQFGQYAYCITAVDHSSARGWWSVVCYLPLQLFFFRLLATVRGILVPWPGIKPMAPAVEVWSLNHWTDREIPCALLLLEVVYLKMNFSGKFIDFLGFTFHCYMQHLLWGSSSSVLKRARAWILCCVIFKIVGGICLVGVLYGIFL